MSVFRTLLLAAAVTGMAVSAAAPVQAKCTRLGFSVNDYGKEGPTNDAKRLLDGYIAKWATDNGVAKYTVGQKSVQCELFLDFIVFDEHTCRAEADVCWNDGSGSSHQSAAAAKPKSEKKAAAGKKAAKAVAETPAAEPAATKKTSAASATSNITTGAISKPTAKPALDAEPAVQKPAAPEEEPSAPPSKE